MNQAKLLVSEDFALKLKSMNSTNFKFENSPIIIYVRI